MKVFPPIPLTLAALLLVSCPALAQTKVGFVDIERILRDSPAAQQTQLKLREELYGREQELSKKATQLKAMQASLEDNALTMSESERRTRERQLDEAKLAFQREQRTFNEDVNRRREEGLGGVIDGIYRAAKQIAEAERFDIIVGKVVWGSPGIDITDKVIKALDASGPKTP